jgi:preprotein translocase subunit YajC|tara:strand:- start:57 stop:239 length:183 start_codon:yes stop_codon:yes gene_type:complete
MGTHQTKVNKLKEGDDILYSCGDMVGSGTVFQIKETEIIVQTGNGARGLEYINKSQVIFK